MEKGKFDRFIDKSADFFRRQIEKQNVTLEQYAEKMRSKGTISYVEEDGEIIGVVVGYTHDTPDNTSYITQVYVLPEYRKSGYSRYMLEEYFDYCREQKLNGVWLTTKKSNIAAQKAYERVGFQIDPSYEHEYLIKYYLAL